MFSPVQTTSGAFNYNPSLGEFLLVAFGKIQVRPAEITQSHMLNARMCANLILSEISNLQPNLWEVGLQTLPLTQGVATYAVPASTVMILDLYISTGTNAATTNDRYLWPVSRTEYASYSNKTQQGTPTVFWYDRLISQNITFYLVPDGNGPYTAKFYSVRQTQDADVTNGQNVEIPYRWYDAYVSGLAWKLSEIYMPQLEDKLFARYTRALQIAQTNDVENVPLMIAPGIGGYFEN